MVWLAIGIGVGDFVLFAAYIAVMVIVVRRVKASAGPLLAMFTPPPK